jgi:hydrogenase nickel incorporation protein HypA/HybF
MHEHSLMAALLRTIEGIAQQNEARRVVAVRVRVGGWSGLTPDHLREHFVQVTQGTLADGARLEVEEAANLLESWGQELVLLSVEVEP